MEKIAKKAEKEAKLAAEKAKEKLAEEKKAKAAQDELAEKISKQKKKTKLDDDLLSDEEAESDED